MTAIEARPATGPHINPNLPDRVSMMLANEAIRRAGDNLVCAIEYGSHVTGDAKPSSSYDLILVVEDTLQFYRDNIPQHGHDFGRPRSARFHDALNQLGFNFYQTTIPQEDGEPIHVKYAVISRANFVKGCNGALAEREQSGEGGFGLYVAGRMQKVAIRPIAQNDERMGEIHAAIHQARVDGVKLALGLQQAQFSVTDLVGAYVSLSYLADLRVERPDKIQTLIDRSRQQYEELLTEILAEYEARGEVRRLDDGRWEKLQGIPTSEDVMLRLRRIRRQTAIINYAKNPLTVGPIHAIEYALGKVRRAHSG
ncbi:MAG TPA: hypothetical protein VF820_05825 [Patescibacteria group bacterium]